MRRLHAALLAIPLLAAATPAPAYEILAQTQFGLGGPSEGSLVEPEVSAVNFIVEPVTGNIIDISSFVSGASGELKGRSRVDIVGGTSTLPAMWTALLREDLVLEPDLGAPEVVVRGNLQVTANSSAVYYPASAQGYAFQHVQLHIEFEDNAPAANIQADGHMVQTDPAELWGGTTSVLPPEAGTATGSIESGSVDLEVRIPVNLINFGDVLRVEVQLSGEADAGNHPTSYAESGLIAQLGIDVGGGTYTAGSPLFLSPEPDTALLGAIAVAALAGKRVNRARSEPKRSKADRAADAVARPLRVTGGVMSVGRGRLISGCAARCDRVFAKACPAHPRSGRGVRIASHLSR